MLFLLAMEPLHRIFKRAQEQGLLKQLSSGCDTLRASLYANDVVVFINPIVNDLQVTISIVSIFQMLVGSKQKWKRPKSILSGVNKLTWTFCPRTIWSLLPFHAPIWAPLCIKKLPKPLLMNLVHKVANRLLGWKRNLLTYPQRKLLLKIVLSTVPILFLTVFKLPKWGAAKIDRFRRSLIWKGHDPENIKGCHCLVNWQVCTRPRKLGGWELRTWINLVEPFVFDGFGTIGTK
jgi:hypothetical protein